jgi:phosphoribosylformylglycinamidine synthase
MTALTTLLACPDLASKRWIWEQYDHLVMGDTVQRPGGDAAVVRVRDTRKALALTTDCTPRYCVADPVAGGAQAVAESWRNLTAVGARPIAITDNMNFGNPERPEIMGQFVGCIEGMRAACMALDYPVVSGNVSLYNETNGAGIWPTPAIGGVGLLDDAATSIGLAFKPASQTIILIGDTKGHLGASLYLREIEGREEGAPPPVDLAAERRNGDFVRAQIQAGRVGACHDLSDGGLLVALAEMAMAGGVGAEIAPPPLGSELPLHGFLFGEDQARYVLTTGAPESVLEAAAAAGVPALRLGTTGGAALTVHGAGAISSAELRRVNEAWLPSFMAAR